jgi:hypothetical protein
MMAPGREKQTTRYKVQSAKYNRTSEARRRAPKWNVDLGRREHTRIFVAFVDKGLNLRVKGMRKERRGIDEKKGAERNCSARKAKSETVRW